MADRPIAFHVRETSRDGRWRVVTHHFLSREAFESELHWWNVRDRGFRSHDEEPAAQSVELASQTREAA